MPSPINRREFLERTAATAAGAGLFGLAGQQATSAQSNTMFISLPPWAVARNVGWPEQARLAAKVGYGGIDWAFGPARMAGVDVTKALLAELKIQATVVNIPISNQFGADEAAFRAALPKLDEDMAFSKAIGCRSVISTLGATVPAGQTREDRWKFVRDRLAAISEVIGKHDVHYGLEFLGPLQFRMGRGGGGGGRRGTGGAGAGAPGAAGQAAPPAAPPAPPPTPPAPPTAFVYTLADTVKLATESGPYIGACLDAWHWYHSGGTVADILATDKSRIIHVHVSDAKPMPPEQVQDSMRWFAGEGIIDLTGFFQALKKIGYTGGVAPETIGDRVPADMAPEESARLALEATRAVMKKAGVI